MFIENLKLKEYRTYQELDLTFNPGITVLVGKNGQGKTNIVESIIYATYLESHRVAGDTPLIKQGAQSAQISLQFEKNQRKQSFLLELNLTGSNKAFLNQNQLRRKNEIIGNINSIYFSPEDLDIVRGDPSVRRKFIDQVLIQTTPRFAGVFTDYERALKQRNSGLKNLVSAAVLEPFTKHLLELGAEIITARVNLLKALTPHLVKNYQEISGESSAVISYQSSAGDFTTDLTNNLQTLEQYAQTQTQRELERKVTLFGPHRDNLFLGLREFPVFGYASHGESWSYVLALKLAVLEYLRGLDIEPILILDDVFAELDTVRRAHLISLAKSTDQTIITAAVEADIPAGLTGQVFYVTTGKVSTSEES